MKQALLTQLGFTQFVLDKNLDGVSHDQSLIAPDAGGNCLNWVVGHIINSRDALLRMLGETSLWGPRQADIYARGSSALTAEQADVVPLDMLREYLKESHARMVAAVEGLTDEDLDRVVDGPLGSDPLRKQLAGLVFHEAYHAGQTGILRRVAGLEGAMK